MSNDYNEQIVTVCCDIFEQLAFMFGETIDLDEAESDSEIFFRASMTFKGEHEGSIDIIVPKELAELLAVNILGIEDDADSMEEGTAEDALKELLNTICGKLLPIIYGDDKIFDLSPPLTSRLSTEEWEALLEDENYFAIEIEEQPVLILPAL